MIRSALVFGIATLMVVPIAAQPTHGSAQAKLKADPTHWTPSVTVAGQPDLQGNWVNKNATPLERPKQLEGREFLTDAEVAELKARAIRIFGDGNSDAANGDAVFLAALASVARYKSETPPGPTM